MFIIFIMFALYFSLMIQDTTSIWYFHCLFFMCFTFEVSPICLSIGTLNRTFCQFIWLICDIFFKDKVLVINALSIIKKNAPMQRYWSSFVFLPNCFLYLNLNTGGIFMGESTHEINHEYLLTYYFVMSSNVIASALIHVVHLGISLKQLQKKSLRHLNSSIKWLWYANCCCNW